MKHASQWIGLLALVLIIALIVVACGGEEESPPEVEVTRVVTQEVPIEVTRIVEVTPAGPVGAPEPTPEEVQPQEEPAQPVVEIPFLNQWLNSPHNDAAAEAFIHWNEEDPPEIPPACARCHSTPGYRDYIGADGTAPGVTDNPAPIGTTIECVACHNDVTRTMDSVVMPSGVELTGLGDEARCMQCHQGRHSTVSVNQAIAEAGVDLDTVSEDLQFLNIHYYAAAATKYGTHAKGGYQYEGKSYDGNFAHVEGFTTCIECHDSHTLELALESCAGCHTDVTAPEDLKAVRMEGSLVDYDGDGDVTEGIYHEIVGLQEKLYQAIQTYATAVAGTPIVYEAHTYPYFFIDSNANGKADADEANYGNRYNAWTPRLLRAAYNYQVSQKDPGNFAHGGKYIIQLLYDSTEDLNAAIPEPVDLSTAHRIDAGHFAGSEEAFRHWDEDGEVPGSCSKCHSAGGLPLFLKEGVTISQPVANGFQCTTCHNDLSEFTRYQVDEIVFPSGKVASFGPGEDSNLCATCHQGRESTVSVNRLIAGVEDDAVSDQLRFLNVHYFAAGATRFGTEAQGAYEYDGQTYVGFYDHVKKARQCADCHEPHGLTVQVETCVECHDVEASLEGLRAIREDETDYDGDGDITEGIAGEIDTLRDTLYQAIQTYAAEILGSPIIYVEDRYPYYFNDTNGNGVAEPDEVSFGNRFNNWTPRLLKAAYNYQYATKDPGGFTHNGRYILQILYDSLADLSDQTGIDMTGMVRP